MTKVRRLLNLMLVALVIMAAWVVYCHPDWIVAGPPHNVHKSITCPQFVRGYADDGTPICGSVTGCAYGDSIPLEKCPDLNPNRPYYDAQGNQYDYQGNLINPAPQAVAPMEGK